MGWSHSELQECGHCNGDNCENWSLSEHGQQSSGTLCLDCGIESYPKISYNRMSLEDINEQREECFELPPLTEFRKVDETILEDLEISELQGR
tara:strand:+ start:777 stop:1055 length:279 start_codon:yes stop_codon:yes gene_type:complete